MALGSHLQERISRVLLLGRKLSQLPPAELLLLLEALVCLCLASCRVHLLPYRALRRSLRSIDQTPPAPPTGQTSVEAIARAVNRASRMVPGAACLTRAIAASRMMKREGYAVRIQFGVAQPAEGFGAHCWVELEGVAVLGGTADYEPLQAPALPGQGSSG